MRMRLNDKGVASKGGSRKREMRWALFQTPESRRLPSFFLPLTRHVGADGTDE